MKNKTKIGVSLVSAIALLSGCDSFKSEIHVTWVELNETRITLSIGEDYVLEATVHPRNATNQRVSWTSSDDKAVIVSPDGLVYALSGGASIITVTTEDGGYTASCIVEVKDAGGAGPSNPSSNPVEDGSLAAPFSAAGAIDYIKGSSYNKDAKVYVKGKISSIKYPFSEEYGTAVFNISDDGKTSSTQFTCYSVYYLENKPWVNGYAQVSVGDDIIAYGKVIYYEKASTFETAEKQAFIYSLNGKTMAEDSNTGGQSGDRIENGHEWVDMGLPSGTKWATCNVGAASNSEAGALYSWGEITTKDSFSWENYGFTITGNSYENIKLSKYVTSSRYGAVDNKQTLEVADDVANVAWGGNWRMPTKVEAEELLQNCTWSSSISGWTLTSKKNGNTLFVPFMNGEGRGDYWTSSLSASYPFCAWRFYCNMTGFISKSDDVERFKGFLIRPVLSDDGASEYDTSGDGTENGHYWVDLGLSSGVKWATCNLGASSPDVYGSYFAWAETKPKSDYSWSTLKYCKDSNGNKFSKYISYDSDYGTIDNKLVLDLSDDAARSQWGGKWRMPTRKEQQELYDECTWSWTTKSGKNGYKVTSKKNGKSIFLPAAGSIIGKDYYDVGTEGCYWSSTLDEVNPPFAESLVFISEKVYIYMSTTRCDGLTIRAVFD